jgi:Tol biopolymer transport system component
MRRLFQLDPFDRIVLPVVALLIVVIGVIWALGDHVGVPIVGYTPGQDQRPPSTARITITFGQLMHASTVEAGFQIVPAVEGDFTWQANTLIFTPRVPLSPGKTYTVSLARGALSQQGRRTIRDLVWSFVPRMPGILYLAPADVTVRGLWFVSADGSAAHEVSLSEYGILNFAPSPDGAQIALASYDDTGVTDIWLIDSLGTDPRRITDCAPGACANPAWSPDGTRLAYERQEPPIPGQPGPGPSRVWLYDLASEETAPVYQDNQVLGYGPRWSPDGRRLAFFDANVQGVRVLDLQSGEAMVIPTLMGEVGTFAPDGSRMVYTDIRPVGRQFFPYLMLADLDQEGLDTLLPEEDQEFEAQAPAWSPDGRWIAFGRRRLDRQEGWGSQLTLYDIESGETRQITAEGNYNNTAFQWDASGRMVLIQRFNLDALYARAELWVYNLETETLTQVSDNGFGGQWLP